MATIGSLAVNITAVTDGFNKGIGKAKSALSGFVKNVSIGQAAIATAVAAGLAAIASEAIEAGGKIQELTAKLRVSSEALTALHYAADQMESSAAAVDAGISKMSITLGKAVQGGDDAQAAFARLGLDWNKLARLDVEKQFLAVIDALHRIPNAAEQAAAAQAIFGKGAKELSALIAAGSEKIVEYGQKAAEVGAVVSSDTVAALDDAGDAINSFSASWAALKMQLVGTFAPAITIAIDAITSQIKVLKTVWYSLQLAIVTGCEMIGRYILGLERMFNSIAPKFAQINTQADQQAVESFARSRGELTDKISTVWGGSGNPLDNSQANSVHGSVQTDKEKQAMSKQAAKDKKVEEKKIAENTKITNEQLKQLVQNTKPKKGAKLEVAGVR